jgi:hypothetical protein
MMARFTAGLALWLWVLPAFGADWGVSALMELLRAHRPGKATFHETKYLALLERPVESSGVLVFTPPDRLEKSTTGLNAEKMVVDRETLTVERLGRKNVLSMREYPQIGVLVESIRGTLAGDLPSLEKTYALALEGDARSWKLTLRPRDAALLKIVTRIEIGGAQAQVRRVEIQQADGDRSVMLVTPAAP